MNTITQVTPEIRLHDGKAVTTSIAVAQYFTKTHDNVLKKIRSLITQLSPDDCAVTFNETVIDVVVPASGGTRKDPAYEITKRGFTLLAMGFTGEKALQFKLRYIDAFEAMEAQLSPTQIKKRLRRSVAQHPALPPSRRIRSRDDLSFTKRDTEGRLINWIVQSPVNSWHEHHGIGEIWFNEIVELARHSPEDAYIAMKCAGPALMRYSGSGHADGFFDRMARWALSAILTQDAPDLPFQCLQMGMAPLVGMDSFLEKAAPNELEFKSIVSRLRDPDLRIDNELISEIGRACLEVLVKRAQGGNH
ncbi:Rha family transcriptional regulator [Candidatus Methylospira mobilis]|nr:Rha family transcriptional regulator [Candidatus Methylospira mobilis]